MKKIDIKPGTRFGSWTVIKESDKADPSGNCFYLCRCDCGVERPVRLDRLLSGKSTSCGTCGTSRAKKVFNKEPIRANVSGRKGVRWHKKNQRWEAYITFKGERKYLGQYYDKEDAIHAREAAEAELERKFREHKKAD